SDAETSLNTYMVWNFAGTGGSESGRFAQPLGGVVEPVGGDLLGVAVWMDVVIQGEGDRRVTEPGGDDVRRFSQCPHPRCAGVPEAVRGDARQVGGLADARESCADDLR